MSPFGDVAGTIARLARRLFGDRARRRDDYPFCLCPAPAFEDVAKAIALAEAGHDPQAWCDCAWHRRSCPAFSPCPFCHDAPVSPAAVPGACMSVSHAVGCPAFLFPSRIDGCTCRPPD